MLDRIEKPEPIWTALWGGCFVAAYDFAREPKDPPPAGTVAAVLPFPR